MTATHGTVVAIDGKGVLLRGPSGAGKSDLALRLIDEGAVLVADDRVVLTLQAGQVVAAAPPAIHSRLEVRGIGIVRMAVQDRADLTLVVDLIASGIERLPIPETVDLLGVALPMIRVSPFESSTPAKIRLAVRAGGHDIDR